MMQTGTTARNRIVQVMKKSGVRTGKLNQDRSTHSEKIIIILNIIAVYVERLVKVS